MIWRLSVILNMNGNKTNEMGIAKVKKSVKFFWNYLDLNRNIETCKICTLEQAFLYCH